MSSFPQKQTFVSPSGTSAMCQKQTSSARCAPRQLYALSAVLVRGQSAVDLLVLDNGSFQA